MNDSLATARISDIDYGIKLAQKVVQFYESTRDGFAKPGFEELYKEIFANTSLYNDQSTGHPDRRSSIVNSEWAERFYSGDKINYYQYEGKADSRAIIADYANLILLQPEHIWEEQIKRYTKEFRDEKPTFFGGLKFVEEQAKKFRSEIRTANNTFSADDVVITLSGTAAFVSAMIGARYFGSQAVAPEGYYNAYNGATKLAGMGITIIDADAEDNYRIKPGAYLNAIKNDATICFAAYPHANPTGNSLSKEDAYAWAHEAINIEKYLDENEPKRKVIHQFDEVYAGISEKGVIDHSVTKALKEIAENEPGKAHYVERVLNNSVVILSNSKLNHIPAHGGAVVTKVPEIKELAAGLNGSLAVGGMAHAEIFVNFIDKLMNGYALDMASGIDPRPDNSITRNAESYNKERRFFNEGLISIAEAAGLTKKEMIPQNYDKALYSFPRLKNLLSLGSIPDDIEVESKGKTYNVRKVVLDDPASGKITTSVEAARILIIASLIPEVNLGIRTRPGEWFGDPKAIRFNITGDRKKHERSIGVIHDLCTKILGIECNKPLDKIIDEATEKAAISFADRVTDSSVTPLHGTKGRS